ncbi:hypothetical protein B0T20DRAFT_348197 [Sordaria brevicollis]|uniref:Uncharacterized protein n=1 Tax=Sordaria brevicollis TaxID=83679 RepID=A0AAE0PJK0_SORBR|nr:hypothetical protein B0T20DRAFT_348197 [Sordaria brevicollis]
MADLDQNDPFHWDVERVVKELCTSERTWDAPPPHKLPDPERLAFKLRELDIDGETLLTYPDVYGWRTFWEQLNIRKLAHHLSIGKAIRHFQESSVLYYRQKKDVDLPNYSPGATPAIKPDPLDPPEPAPPIAEGSIAEPTAAAIDGPVSEPSSAGVDSTAADAQPATVGNAAMATSDTIANNVTAEASPAMPSGVSLQSTSRAVSDLPSATAPPAPMEAVISQHCAPAEQAQDSIMSDVLDQPPESPEKRALDSGLRQDNGELSMNPEPPLKKRRIAPIMVSAAAPAQARAFIPTEGDMFYDPLLDIPSSQTEVSFRSTTLPTSAFPSDVNFDRFLDAEDSKFSYLGSSALRSEDITHLPYDFESDDDRDNDEVSDELNWVRPAAVPPARALQVARLMRKLFRQRSPSVNEDEDVVLDLGEDDDGMSVDSETYREYEEEEREREAQRNKSKPQTLSEEQAEKAVHDAFQKLEVSWEKVKRPKLERKAWKIWQDARRNSTRSSQIVFATKQLKNLEVRLRKLTQELLDQKWFKEDKIEVKAEGFLEESVYDRKYQAWLIDLLKNPHEPPKPSTLPRLKPEPKKQRETLESDEELLTSDSEGEDHFIEDDLLPVDHMIIDPLELNPPTGPSTPDRHPNSATEESINQIPEGETDAQAQLPAVDNETGVVSKVEPTTPQRVIHTIPTEPIEVFSSPADVDQLDNIPPLTDIETIGKYGTEFWAKHRDRERLVIAALWRWSPERQSEIFDAIQDREDKDMWKEHIQPFIDRAATGISRIDVDPDSTSLILALLFLTYSDFSEGRLNNGSRTLRCVTCQKINREHSRFESFFKLLQDCVGYFRPRSKPPTPMEMDTAEPPEAPQDDAMDITDPENTDSDDEPSQSTKNGRKPKRDEKAKDLRKHNKEFLKQLEDRRQLLRAKLSETQSVPGGKSRLIINETKESDDLPLIYVHEKIGKYIKDHQIDGVRFMWDQIVVDSGSRQGCLLAHTMGLGKTMQVITLLVAIAESSQSEDPRIVAQIPEDLQEGRALILCPSGLVENWMTEIFFWAPEHILGKITKIDAATVPPSERVQLVKEWAGSRGVLVIGYEMFRSLVSGNEDNVAELLHSSPSIVICDEAHRFKNRSSLLYKAVQGFDTMSRIAMTGSPLTKNVMDYYSMINWVAPNYLSDVGEFNQRFAEPISEGLHADSSAEQKTTARRRLHVLKVLVAPKVNRKDIQVLVDELPQKREFILTVQMTKVQRDAYREYLETARRDKGNDLYQNACVWGLVASLKLLLAHPKIFKKKLEERLRTNPALAKSKKRITNEEDPDSDENDESLELSGDTLRNVLAKVSMRNIDDDVHSTKVIVLLKIIEECKQVGDKVLVFSQSIPTLDYLEDLLKRKHICLRRLDGKTPVGQRQAAIADFNSRDSLDVYLISTRAGGVGLNIPGANRVVLFDFGFTPAEEQQAVGRAYRIGQKKPVYVYHLKVGGTYETAIHNLAVFKKQLSERVVDKKKPVPSSTRMREYFINPPDNLEQKDLSGVKGLDKVLDNILASAECGNIIREIDSTETFEREEVFKFKPEEEKALDEEAEQYKRRGFLNPESSLPSHPESLGTPTSAGVPHHLRDKPNPTQPGSVSIIPPPPSNHVSAGTQVGASTPRVPPSTTVSPAVAFSPDPANGQAAGLDPILGNNTHYKVNTEVPRKPETLRAPEIIPKPRKAEDITPTLLEALDEVHKKLRDEGYHTSIHPQDLVMQINSECDRQDMAAGTLPRMDKLRLMCSAVTESARFGEALLTGYLTPREAVSMGRAQTKERMAAYSAMTEDAFKQETWAHHKANHTPDTTAENVTVKTENPRTRPPPPPPPIVQSSIIDRITASRDGSSSTTTTATAHATPSRTLTEEEIARRQRKKEKKEKRKRREERERRRLARLGPGGTADMPLVIDDD